MKTNLFLSQESLSETLLVVPRWIVIQLTWGRIILSAPFILPGISNAQITKPKIGGKELAGDDPIADLGIVIGGAGGLAVTVIEVAVYLVAAYLIIFGLITGWKKSEWGQFFLGIVLAIVMFVVSTYFLSQGESALEGLNT